MNAESELTPADRELRARLVFILICLMVVFTVGWIGWFHPYDDLFDRSGMQLGGDFPVFYVQARFAAEGRWQDLYDFAEQGEEMRRFLPGMPEEKFLPALYPPWTAAGLRIFASSKYWQAYALFIVFSLMMLLVMLRSWTHAFPMAQGPWKIVVLLAAFGFPLILETLISGQASVLAVFAFGVSAAFLQRNHPITAGVVLGLAAYKPNVLALVIVGVVLRWPKSLIGLAIAGAVLLAATAATAGLDSIRDYLQVPGRPEAQQALANPPIHKFHGIAASTPFTRNTPVRVAVLAVALIGVVAAARLAYRNRTEPGISSIFLATLGMLQLLGNPYLPIYDLALLFPIAFLFANGLSERYGPSVGRHVVFAHFVLAVLFIGAYLSQGMAQSIGWQPFGWLFIPAAWWGMWELSKSRTAEFRVGTSKRCAPSEPIRIDCQSVEDVSPPDELAGQASSGRHVVLRFRLLHTDEKAALIARLSVALPEHSVFNSGGQSPACVTILSVVARARVLERRDDILRAIGEYRRTCKALVEQYRGGTLSSDWHAREHGGDCRFTNRRTGQSVEAPIRESQDPDRVDPQFFSEFVKSTTGFEAVADLIAHDFHDGLRILEVIGEREP